MRTRRNPQAVLIVLLLVLSLIAIWELNQRANPVSTGPTNAIPTAPGGSPTPIHTSDLPAPISSPVSIAARYSFAGTGSLNVARQGHTATLLSDGRVLIAGGLVFDQNQNDVTLANAELYDPATGAFSYTGSLLTPRANATATLLPDGRVLIVGGQQALSESPWHQVLASAEVYDSVSGKFSYTGSLHSPHAGQSATLLSDGRVLITGGESDIGAYTYDAELYDPASGQFTALPQSPLSSYRAGVGVVLNNDEVLTLGFNYSGSEDVLGQIYDPVKGTFSLLSAGPLTLYSTARAAKLADGRVLMVNGNAPGDSTAKAAEIYDPVSDTYSLTGVQIGLADFSDLVVLPSGRALLVAGVIWPIWPAADPQSLPVWDHGAEIYDPVSNTFSALSPTSESHYNGTATLLDDGRVLIVGGGDYSADNLASSAAELLSDDQP